MLITSDGRSFFEVGASGCSITQAFFVPFRSKSASPAPLATISTAFAHTNRFSPSFSAVPTNDRQASFVLPFKDSNKLSLSFSFVYTNDRSASFLFPFKDSNKLSLSFSFVHTNDRPASFLLFFNDSNKLSPSLSLMHANGPQVSSLIGDADESEQGSGLHPGWWAGIGLGTVALVVVAAIAFLRSRRKHKSEDDGTGAEPLESVGLRYATQPGARHSTLAIDSQLNAEIWL
jgi:hypothetical protein